MSSAMVSSAMAFPTVYSMPYRIFLQPEPCSDRRTAGSMLPCSKVCWLFGDGEIRYDRSLMLKRRLIGLLHRRRDSEKTLVVLPRASFSFEAQAQHLAESGKNLISLLQSGASAAVKISPVWLSLQSPSENTLEGFLNNLSSFPINISIAAIAAAAGTASYLVAAMPMSKKENTQNKDPGDAEQSARDWLLVMNSTPFNRFVLMRCPSIVFEEADVYEGDLAQKLTTEGRHYVRLRNDSDSNSDSDGDDNGDADSYDHGDDSGDKWAGCVSRIASRSSSSFAEQVGEGPGMGESVPFYQRTFLHTGDGGVLAIDWPSHLELSGEHGLDTTFLFVPGSADGSGHKNVKNLAQRSLRYGYFPVVVNPRGCGGSPLTTPRLFTAGDSDDIRAAVRFVLKSRPSSTIMAVGWGYGANMLVKYLGEEAAATPVTAAICIENPFDLQESTKSSQDGCGTAFDLDMTEGFVQILKSNQMVFQGKKKEFDVQKGLSARSVRDFDEAISRVSKGFDNVQDFYEDSSSKSWINNVKIPIFCIQANDTIGRTFSIPRHVFEENPFTTLILSLKKRWKTKGKLSKKATGYHDSLVIEWLAAVELAFLKGRHPLLQEIDVTFKPPKEWSLFGQQLSIPQNGESLVGKRNPSTGIKRGSNYSGTLANTKQRATDWELYNTDQHMYQGPDQKDSNTLVDASKGINNVGKEKGPINGSDSAMDKGSHEGSDGEDGDGSDEDDYEGERGQVQQAAESVMKVLDVTMPGTLSEKKKEEVLEAVGRGETIVAALQEACPEDVREKMATAVSAAVQARGISLKLAGFGKGMPAPKIPDGMKEKIQEKLSSIVHHKLPAPFTNGAAGSSQSDSATESSDTTMVNGNQSSVQPQVSVQGVGAKDIVKEFSDTKPPESDTKPPESNASAVKLGATAPVSQDGTGSVMEPPLQVDLELPQGFTSQIQGQQTHEKEMPQNKPSENKVTEQERGNDVGIPAGDDNGANQEGESSKQGNPFLYQEQKSDRQGQKQESFGTAEQTNGPGPEETQTEKKSDSSMACISSSEDQNRKVLGPNLEEVLSPQIPAQSPAPSPLSSIDMRGAFQALTGVDDSTQMAVTNVFGVIENVIERLEKEQGQKDVQPERPSSQKEHQVSSIEGSDGEEDSGNESQKQTSVQDELSGGNSGHLGAGETTKTDDTSQGGVSVQNDTELVNSGEFINRAISPKIAGIVNVDLKRKLGETSAQWSIDRGMIQDSEGQRILKSDQDVPAINMPSVNTGLENDSTSDSQKGIGDADVALEYFEDENIWKIISSTLDTSVPQDHVEKRRESWAMNMGKGEHWNKHESLFGKLKSDMPTSSEITEVIEPAYIILDDEMKIPEIQSHVGNFSACDDDANAECASGSISMEGTCEQGGMGSTSSPLREKVQEIVVDSLELELLRRLGDSGMEMLGTALHQDIAKIGSAVAEMVKLDIHYSETGPADKRVPDGISKGIHLQRAGTREKLHAETIISAINGAYGDTVVLPRLIPAGLVFGIVLAALSPLDMVSTDNVRNDHEIMQIEREESGFGNDLPHHQTSSDRNLDSTDTESSQVHTTHEIPLSTQQQHGSTTNDSFNKVDDWEDEEGRSFLSKKIGLLGGVDACDGSTPAEDVIGQQMTPSNNRMMNVVAAAMGATAALASQRPSNENSSTEHESPEVGSDFTSNGAAKCASEMDDDKADGSDNKASIVSTLAEKAMSVAAPVVPTKEDGGVDHERLVEILAGLGQKGGILRYIGKVALLWGGLRGAMSLTDRLLVFLHMSDRPLYQRLLCFVVMALLLWSPILVPLFPTLLQQWASRSHSGVSSTAALIGLYGAVVILVTIWGRKIRGYEDPLHQYGVKLQSPFNARQLQSLMIGLTLGLSLVASIYLLGVSLGFIQFSWTSILSFDGSKTLLSKLASGWRILKLIMQCLGISLAVSFVEELLFRSWLQDEISADLGFHRASVLSGLAFSVSHWSLPVAPGLWLLSLLLTGVKVRCNGDLDLAIGIHAGLIAGNQIINLGGQVKYGMDARIWFIGTQTSDPFTGLIGVSILGVLALLLYPWDYGVERI